MFSATDGRYSQFCSQDQCPSTSVHKIPIFAFPYEKVCTQLHSIYSTPHRHAQIQICVYLLLQLTKGKAWLFALWKFIRRLQFPTVYKMWFSINMIFILIFSVCSYALPVLIPCVWNHALSVLFLHLPLYPSPQLWMVTQISFKCYTKNQLAFSVVFQKTPHP